MPLLTFHPWLHDIDIRGAALYAGARDNNIEQVRQMLEQGADVNWQNPSTVGHVWGLRTVL